MKGMGYCHTRKSQIVIQVFLKGSKRKNTHRKNFSWWIHMDTIGCFKKSCLCFCLKSMPVTQTDRNGNGRWRPEGGPGPRLSTAVCSSCFLLGLIRFLCWLRADRDVVMASVSGWLKKKKTNKTSTYSISLMKIQEKNKGCPQNIDVPRSDSACCLE